MHSLFTPADTLDGASFLHSVVQTNNSFDLQWLVPVTGLENNGQPVTPPSGFRSISHNRRIRNHRSDSPDDSRKQIHQHQRYLMG